MHKIIAIFLTSSLMSTQLFAFKGAYVGGAVGGNIFTGSQNGNTTLTSNELTSQTIDLSTDLFSSGFSGMIYGGIGYYWKCLYGGFEVFGQHSSNNIHQRFENINVFASPTPAIENTVDVSRAKISSWQWGIDARPGFLLDPTTLAYFRVGVAFPKFSFKNQSSFSDTVGPVFDLSIDESVNKRKSALRLGCGIEKHICDRFSLRADYIYTNYGKLAVNESGSFTDVFTFDLAFNNRVSLKSHCLMLGLSYYFCKDPCVKEIPVCCVPQFCGFYLGGGIGGALVDSKNEIDFVSVAPGAGNPFNFPTTHSTHTQLHQNRKNFRGTIFGGYGLQYGFNCLQLFTALEPFLQYSPYSRSTPIAFSASFPFNVGTLMVSDYAKMTHTKIDPWQYGIDGRIGFLATPQFLLYGTIGTSVARIHATADSQLNVEGLINGVVVVNNTLNVPLSARSTRATLRAGAGLEYALWGRCHLRADYRYTDYRTLHMHGSAAAVSTLLGALSLDVSSKLHLRDHAITVGLNWYLF